MIIIDRNKITVNQFDLCILDLKLCEYNLKEGDKIEINIDGEITEQNYDNLDIQFNTDNNGNADGVHPNDLGHKIISTKIIQFLKTLI